MRRKLAALLLGLVGLGGAANYANSFVGGCGAGVVFGAVDLCSSSPTPLGGGVTQFSYDFGLLQSGSVTLAIPLLDANAIIPGTLSVTGGMTANLVTNPTQVDFAWNFVTSDPAKEAFETPAALISIFGSPNTSFFTLSFNSYNPVVDGPILVQGIYIDPPLPGAAVPEPATLALLGFGLAGLAAARRRRAS